MAASKVNAPLLTYEAFLASKRQPYLSFIGNDRHALIRPPDDPDPLDPAPQIVAEIVTPSDTPSVLSRKLEDYCSVGLEECWIVRQNIRTGEVLRRTANAVESTGIYSEGDTVRSLTFPNLTMDVAAVFADA